MSLLPWESSLMVVYLSEENAENDDGTTIGCHDVIATSPSADSGSAAANDAENELIVSTPSDKRPSAISETLESNLRNINIAFNRWTHKLGSRLPRWQIFHQSDVDPVTNEIGFSVFKQSHYEPLSRLPYEGFLDSGPVTQNQFENIVDDCIRAMEIYDLQPSRISTGSSGSYFVYNSNKEIAGIFKPKDEEPYGKFAVKWTKWLHRNLFPCFFGRSCLIPNLGYICEAGASILDRQLQTYIVPYTDTVLLSSSSFYYPFLTRKKREYPKKEGSFQLFLKNYVGADEFFARFPFKRGKKYRVYTDEGEKSFEWSVPVISEFQEELCKLVILDFIMRNTDRSLDNWMISLSWHKNGDPQLKIGAIDSGLSFPWKHPNDYRSYPYGWLNLPIPIIGQPFSETIRAHFLPLLTSIAWWEDTKVLLRQVFARDKDFKQKMWEKQWSVLKGQAFSIVECLKIPGSGPLDLTSSRKILVWDQEIDIPVRPPVSAILQAMTTPFNDSCELPDTWEEVVEDEIYLKSIATKKVIMERLEFVENTAFFSWC